MKSSKMKEEEEEDILETYPIKKYFTPHQYASLSEEERKDYAKMRQNYEVLSGLGMTVALPAFMKKKSKFDPDEEATRAITRQCKTKESSDTETNSETSPNKVDTAGVESEGVDGKKSRNTEHHDSSKGRENDECVNTKNVAENICQDEPLESCDDFPADQGPGKETFKIVGFLFKKRTFEKRDRPTELEEESTNDDINDYIEEDDICSNEIASEESVNDDDDEIEEDMRYNERVLGKNVNNNDDDDDKREDDMSSNEMESEEDTNDGDDVEGQDRRFKGQDTRFYEKASGDILNDDAVNNDKEVEGIHSNKKASRENLNDDDDDDGIDDKENNNAEEEEEDSNFKEKASRENILEDDENEDGDQDLNTTNESKENNHEEEEEEEHVVIVVEGEEEEELVGFVSAKAKKEKKEKSSPLTGIKAERAKKEMLKRLRIARRKYEERVIKDLQETKPPPPLKPKQKFPCGVCGFVFSRSTHLRRHQVSRMEKDGLSCIKKEEKMTEFKCEHCDKVFKRSYNLRRHIEAMHRKEVVVDKIAEEVTISRFLENPNPTDLKCNLCNEIFESMIDLSNHKENKHSQEEVSGKTQEKASSSTSDENLNASVTLSTSSLNSSVKLKEFKCDTCGKTFNRSNNLKRHELIHKDERPFQCVVCQKSFRQSIHLVQHVRIHTEEKPYECSVCKLMFSRQRHLVWHEKIHTNEKAFKCDICDKRFVRKDYLQVHKKTHAVEKVLNCDVCKRYFTTTAALSNHKKAHAWKTDKTKTVEEKVKEGKNNDKKLCFQ